MKIIETVTRIFLIPILAGSLLSPNGFAEVKEPDYKSFPSAVQVGPELKTPKEKLSYSLGMVLGNQFRAQSVEVDLNIYVQGLKDALSGGKTLLTEEEARAAVKEMQNEMNKKRAAAQSADALTYIKISFKLDPRLTRGMYMGDRWVSPPTYTSTVQMGKELVIEARADGLDAGGRSKKINPEWIPEDPDMVSVTPGENNVVKITVKRAGESKLKVASQEVYKELIIRATYKENAVQVEISQ